MPVNLSCNIEHFYHFKLVPSSISKSNFWIIITELCLSKWGYCPSLLLTISQRAPTDHHNDDEHRDEEFLLPNLISMTLSWGAGIDWWPLHELLPLVSVLPCGLYSSIVRKITQLLRNAIRFGLISMNPYPKTHYLISFFTFKKLMNRSMIWLGEIHI